MNRALWSGGGSGAKGETAGGVGEYREVVNRVDEINERGVLLCAKSLCVCLCVGHVQSGANRAV